MADRPTPSYACPHCEPEHGSPHRCAWAVYVARAKDDDGQPIRLHVLPTDGAHVAEADAEWLRAVIREALANCTHDNHGGAGYVSEAERMRPVIEAVQAWRAAELPPDAHNKVYRALNALAVAIDTYDGRLT